MRQEKLTLIRSDKDDSTFPFADSESFVCSAMMAIVALVVHIYLAYVFVFAISVDMPCLFTFLECAYRVFLASPLLV